MEVEEAEAAVEAEAEEDGAKVVVAAEVDSVGEAMAAVETEAMMALSVTDWTAIPKVEVKLATPQSRVADGVKVEKG